MSKSHRLFLLWVLTVVTSFPAQARADEELLPRDYKQISQNGKYVFVMLAPEKRGLFGLLKFYEENKELRRQYAVSGLYHNKGSSAPLWTVGWYADKVYVSDDGKHLIRIGPWPRVWEDKDLEQGGPALQQPAVGFYSEGKLLKGYAIGDLIVNPKQLPQIVSHFQWIDRIFFDDAAGKLTITTHDQQELFFDVHTGELARK